MRNIKEKFKKYEYKFKDTLSPPPLPPPQLLAKVIYLVPALE